MKRKLIILVTLTVLMLNTGAAYAYTGWLSSDWYSQYYSNYQPQPAPQPVPEPEPAPIPQPQPDPEPAPVPNNGGWLSPQWYAGYFNQAPVPSPVPSQPEQPKSSTGSLTVQEQRMLSLINAERAKRGIPAVKLDMAITDAARLKSQDMVDNGYFAHNSPTYGRVNELLRSQGVQFGFAGEILAKTSSVDRALELYMGSSIHRANLLSAAYTDAGVGVVSRPYGGVMVTVMFVQR